MRKSPTLWTVGSLMEHVRNGPSALIGGAYCPARPLGLYTIGSRFRLAWAVFTGRADALVWPGDQ